MANTALNAQTLSARTMNTRTMNTRTMNTRTINTRTMNTRTMNTRTMNTRTPKARTLKSERRRITSIFEGVWTLYITVICSSYVSRIHIDNTLFVTTPYALFRVEMPRDYQVE